MRDSANGAQSANRLSLRLLKHYVERAVILRQRFCWTVGKRNSGMQVHIEWTARVRASDKVDALEEFADEVKRGMSDSELIPPAAWVESAAFDFSRHAEVVIRYDTVHDMDAGSHEPSSED